MNKVEFGDCRETMRRWAADGVKVQTCVTSPPYFGLRDYGHEGQIGLEETPEQYVAAMVEVFRCVRDVLADDGTLWLNIGDSYAGSWGNQGRKTARGSQRQINGGMLQKVHDGRYPSEGSKTGSLERTPGCKNKDLIGIPWMLAFALRADGWYLRQEIIWNKPNPMPESMKDRCTKGHEQIFLLAKSARYYFDHKAIKEPSTMNSSDWNEDGTPKRASKMRGEFAGKNTALGKESFRAISETRNRRSVWTVATRPYKGAHFATFPPDLIEPCVLAGARHGGIVLDPFMGSGTTAAVALKHGRQYLGCELNPEYEPLQEERIALARAALAAPAAAKRKPPRRRVDQAEPDLFAGAAA